MIDEAASASRAYTLFVEQLDLVYRRRDRVFTVLMAVQWVCGVVIALVYSPSSWAGKIQTTHVHVYSALFLGGALSVPTMVLTWYRPGWVVTRQAVAVAQMGWSALFIHLTGGRIETHFHIFGSLAFLAFYRDAKVVFTATVMIATEHLVRSLTWPESIFGIANPEWWRFAEHSFWVLFEDVVLVLGIRENLREMHAVAQAQAAVESVAHTIEARVAERTLELVASREQYRSLIETTRALPWRYDRSEQRFNFVGTQPELIFGHGIGAWLDPHFLQTHVDPDDVTRIDRLRSGSAGGDFEFRLKRADGSWAWVRCVMAPPDDALQTVTGLMLDVTEHQRIMLELGQAQKLESVGRLASGIAHEINTPVQFVNDSIQFITEAFTGLLPLLAVNKRALADAAAGPVPAELLADVAQAEEDADLDYLIDHVPKALERSVEGLDRVATLVRAMKEFGHPATKEKALADVNQALRSTLIIARNEYKYVADIETVFGQLPLVACHIDSLNQAFLNIIVNASHAIGDLVRGTENRGKIRIETLALEGLVEVRISDTGGGIPEAIRQRVFEPFFTTKGVGRGTGQGLSIVRSVVVEKHGGTVTFETDEGVGTTFVLRLPCEGAHAEPAREAA